MAEILGVGATHYPPGLVPDEYKPWPLVRMLQSDRIPAHMKDLANWPEPMRLEWGEDEGITSHKAHRAQIFDAFRHIRKEIDAFKPDFILMWGDDQYENFREDIIPPFCVLAYDQFQFKPFHRLGGRPNIWGEPDDKVFTSPGHHEAGRYLTRGLLEEGIDMAYAYQPLHGDGLGHAFLTEKNFWAYPDLQADRALLAHLKTGEYSKWKDVELDDVEQSGQQEVLNWFCLVGAMAELEHRVEILEWAETWIFNAPKCMALFK